MDSRKGRVQGGRTTRASALIDRWRVVAANVDAPALHVGTSGWVYAAWKECFYPEDLPQRRWLEHDQRYFDTVELNVTFYRLPRESVFSGWAGRAPTGFRFAVKAPRLVTHYKRLVDVADNVRLFLGRARLLGDHLGPVLWQLPPGLARDDALLRDFLDLLPSDLTHVLEFRNQSWFADPVYDLLRTRRCALVVWHMQENETPRVSTSPVVYVRLHGTTSKYGGAYTRVQIALWARHVRAWLEEGKEVWVYFNNDVGGHAVIDAVRLRKRLSVPASPRGAKRAKRIDGYRFGSGSRGSKR